MLKRQDVLEEIRRDLAANHHLTCQRIPQNLPGTWSVIIHFLIWVDRSIEFGWTYSEKTLQRL